MAVLIHTSARPNAITIGGGFCSRMMDDLEDLAFDDCDDAEGGDEQPTMGWSNCGRLGIQIREEAEQITDFDFDDGPLRCDGTGNIIPRMLR